jgi:hypothetical protein
MTPEPAAQSAAERAADRAAHIAAYSPAPRPAGGRPAPPLDPNDATVQAYAATLAALPAHEVATRMATLAEFCAFAGERPADMIARIFDREAYRYVRRSHYQQRILEFSAGVDGPWEARTAAGDVVRAFFLANGHRIAPARAPWQIWAQMP